MGDAEGDEVASFLAVYAHADRVAARGDDESVPVVEADFGGDALPLTGEHFLFILGKLFGLFAVVKAAYEFEAAGLGIGEVHAGG